ncbi:MAG: hypothetical protein JW782_02985 [Candidatus Saganbacteria bacterium]|nr:hypothetical protein [Candidatus Saganbacteria bacterium]
MDILGTLSDWGSAVADVFGLSGSSSGCEPQVPRRTESETVTVTPAPAPVQEAQPAELTAEAVAEYITAHQELLQQLLDQYCPPPEPFYFICDEECSLSQASGRQGQSFTGVIVHGVPSNLDLNDETVVSRLSVSFGNGIEVTNLRVENNELVVDISIDSEAETGSRNILVILSETNTDGTQVDREIGLLEDGFQVGPRRTGHRHQTPQTPGSPSGLNFGNSGGI